MRTHLLDRKLVLIFFLTGVIIFSYSTVLSQDLFAPKVKVPEKIENHDVWVQMVESWKVPTKEEINLPAYPGAYIVAFMDATMIVANDDSMMTLPSMTLATSDDQAKVVSYYKEHLKDWKYKNSFDMFDIFWDGPDDFNNMDMTQGMTIPNIVIFNSTDGEPNFMPEAKTAITIVYKPTK